MTADSPTASMQCSKTAASAAVAWLRRWAPRLSPRKRLAVASSSHWKTSFRTRLNATCSCPDTAIPCKHIAAVILYIARVLDYNPFLLLELRGKSKSEILNELSLGQGAKSKKGSEKASTTSNIEFKFNVPKISIVELSSEQKKTSTEVDEYNIGFTFRKPGKLIETLENLGVPQNIENKAFEIVLRAIYRKITSKIHDISLELS